MIRRRDFLGLSGAAGLLPAFGNETPRIARIGMMTDTHVGTTMESCSLVRAALRLFKDKGAEMVINCGDLADHHYPEGYRCYRRTVNEVFPDAASRPREVYVYANHDIYEFKPGSGWKIEYAAAAYEDMRQKLEAPNGHTCDFVWKGLPFAVMPQCTGHRDFLSWEDYERTVARLCAEHPGKPVFVCDHVPPAGTTFHSWHWGEMHTRRIFDKYPQVVSISGHVHGSLVSERQIWQGEFTAINLGCLQTWGGFAPGSTPPPQAKPNFGVLVMDVYQDRLVVFRYDVRDGSECGTPWIVPLPFARASAPFVPATAAQRHRARPEFGPDAKVKVVCANQRYQVEFTEVASAERAFMYRLECARRENGAWKTFSRDDIFGDFWVAAKDRTPTASYSLSAGFFEPGQTYRMTVTPLDYFYRPSRSISCEFTASHPPAKELWSAKGPENFRFTEHGRPVPCDGDGFFAPSSGQGTLVLPAQNFAGIVPGRPHRFVFDLRTVQPANEYCAWRMSLAPADAWYRSLAEVQTSSGDPGTLRYVMEFTPGADFPKHCNLICRYHSPGGRLRLDAARLEVV